MDNSGWQIAAYFAILYLQEFPDLPLFYWAEQKSG